MDLKRLHTQNLEGLLATYSYRELLGRVSGRLKRPAVSKRDRPSWLLRHHRSGSVTDDEEIQFRRDVDHLLGVCCLLEIGSQVECLDLEHDRQLQRELVSFLFHTDVRRFYHKHYPLMLPEVLAARLQGHCVPKQATEASPQTFFELLALDARFRTNHLHGVLLDMLDDFYFDEVGFEDVEEVLEDPERFVSMLLDDDPEEANEPLHLAVKEFPHFMLFCVQLLDLLEGASAYPVLQSSCWHYYGYWFDHLRTTLNRKLKRGLRAMMKIVSLHEEGADRESATRSVDTSLAAVDALTSRRFARPLQVAAKHLVER